MSNYIGVCNVYTIASSVFSSELTTTHVICYAAIRAHTPSMQLSIRVECMYITYYNIVSSLQIVLMVIPTPHPPASAKVCMYTCTDRCEFMSYYTSKIYVVVVFVL